MKALSSSRDVLINWNDLDAWCNHNESIKFTILLEQWVLVVLAALFLDVGFSTRNSGTIVL
jgi:hypothetical protein